MARGKSFFLSLASPIPDRDLDSARRYLDEQAFRYNNRKDADDFDRFKPAASRIVGNTWTYAEVNGKAEGQTQIN